MAVGTLTVWYVVCYAFCKASWDKAIANLSEAVSSLDQALFVGRQRELATFRQWLGAEMHVPSVLNVSGRGGVGKTTLLHAFRRNALELGKLVMVADGRDFPATPQGFLAALTGSGDAQLQDVAASLNDARPLILLDTFEELSGLAGYIQDEFLARLDTSVKVVIAGRHPLAWSWDRGDRWHKLVQPLQLGGFSESESREYVARRGIAEPELAQRIAGAAGGNPLALSLATDMALQFDTRDFGVAPQWHLAVRWLAERLLRDINDPKLREVLEACAVVHQFDESTLAAITGRDDVSASFDQLCRLSVVEPSEHGLQLHEDVRRHVAGDLSWRQPRRYSLLRSRALAHYRERLRSASLRDREWLVVESFFLWGNSLIQQIFFDPGEPGRIRVEPRRPSDDAEIRQLFSARMATIPSAELGDEPLFPPAGDDELLDAILRYPAARVRVAREECGRVLGFSAVLPVCQESIRLLDLSPAVTPLLHAQWSPQELANLPSGGDESTSFYLCHIVHAAETPGPVRAALLRDFSGLFAIGGTYLCSTFLPSYKALLEACGFRRIPAAQNRTWGTTYLVDGYVLDLSSIGFERWIEAMVGGSALPTELDASAIESELREVLAHWDDSRWLARSPLVRRFGMEPGPESDRPQRCREMVLSALTEARANSSPDKRLAYHAVELAYLGDGSTRKQAARQLAASRATFYRLVSRGVRGLAQTLARPH